MAFTPSYRLSRRRVVANLQDRLQRYQSILIRTQNQGESLYLPVPIRDQLMATLASYLGHFKHAETWNLQCSLWQCYPWLGEIIHLQGFSKIKPLWEAAGANSLRGQWRYFKQRYPGYIVIVQTGCCAEIQDDDVEHLVIQGFIRQTAKRASFEQTLSLPLAGLKNLRNRLRRLKIPHCFIAEQGYHKRGLKRRVLRLRWSPVDNSTNTFALN